MSSQTQMIAKVATQGGIAAVVFDFMHKDKGTVISTPLGDLSLLQTGFLMGASAAVVADIMHAYVLPEIAPSQKLERMESAALNAGTAAGSFVLANQVANASLIEESGGLGMVAAAGAAVNVASEWAFTNWVSPMLFN